MKFSQFGRLLQINHVLGRHRLDELILTIHFFRPYRFLSWFSPYRWRHKAHVPRGERIRLALQDLGPIFVKFGQILSTRRDLLPEDIADSLAKLQDQVAPFPNDVALALIHAAYEEGEPVRIFSHIDAEPLASASIAQVHAATLTDGKQVILKLVRPGIEKVIRRDVDLLYTLAGLAERYWSEGKRLRPREVVAELEKNLFDELDMLREAASASQLKRHFADERLLYVPEVYWSLTKPNLLVQERVFGAPISNIALLKQHNIDLELLATIGVEIFFTQVFRHSFFHADMHPGNILVDVNNPLLPRYIAIDFGIMGTLSPDDQRYLAENFLAFFNHDYRRVAELHIQSGWVPAETRMDEFESAIRSVCEPIFARPLKEISFGQLLLRLFQTARRFDMQIQPQLVLLQKTLLNIEGLGRDLYPDLDLWQTAKPILEQWMKEKLGWQAAVKSLQKEVPTWAETLPTLPRMLHDLTKQAQAGQLHMQLSSKDLDKIRQEVRYSSYRTATAVSGAAFIVGAAIIKGLDGYSSNMLAGMPVLSWVLGLWGGLMLYFSLRRSD
ncbi:ubiquinone biosynthesis regulatory protein kinase UbiB [Methylophaga nitratireducenticrescens]|uniref:Ubiquinone biosynthesis monooxygenase UbiB n=1 Tax=Methylophaga nitratireducenticrescens TaxID=754476 RepID=I1XL77_METNJ|nr:ubiquinone biosynthesis regulatory protein kinase UbiB [Methylophaga nitratireducenticrescens]AFI85146.1 ubiquinone biosynthesis regulatory protein kinase UbiB [Methylophaga nitratireducenticrescens]AUZ85634.1 ubiquinone biosynthesis regulatory protein kinase UbiB [Methylophaga nitratireducenticrescens]